VPVEELESPEHQAQPDKKDNKAKLELKEHPEELDLQEVQEILGQLEYQVAKVNQEFLAHREQLG